jgi:hypothetical protein
MSITHYEGEVWLVHHMSVRGLVFCLKERSFQYVEIYSTIHCVFWGVENLTDDFDVLYVLFRISLMCSVVEWIISDLHSLQLWQIIVLWVRDVT